MKRTRLNTAIDNIILADASETPQVEDQISDDYKKLNEKCDTVISKIKNRKRKNNKQS